MFLPPPELIFQYFNYVHGCSNYCCVFRAYQIARLLIVVIVICQNLSCQKMQMPVMLLLTVSTTRPPFNEALPPSVLVQSFR